MAPSAKVAPAAWREVEAQGEAEVLVILGPQARLPTLPEGSNKATRGHAVAQALQDHAGRTQAPLRAWLDARGISYRAFAVVNALVVHADSPLLEALAARPEVATITTNPAVALPPETSRASPMTATSLPQTITALPWGLIQIRAPEVWALGYRGEGVVVAGQDTGYDWDHPALVTQYRGWEGGAVDHDYNWHDAIHASGTLCPADSPEPCDDYGHGTHTMGTIVGQNPTSGTTIGVAPAAAWIGCRNMRQGVGTPASYIECFDFFLAPYPVGGTPEQGDATKAPDVINNSWACPPAEGCLEEHILLLEQAVASVRAAGILVVSSAGNQGPSCSTISEPPATYDAATTIGATDSTDTVAGFSSRGPAPGVEKPDLTAPGVNVYSSLPNGAYGMLSGTSMAAPHVAGAAALLWSARPDLRGRIEDTEWLLKRHAVPLTSTQCGDAPDAVPNRVYGWGRLDVLASLVAARQGVQPRAYLPILIHQPDAVHSEP